MRTTGVLKDNLVKKAKRLSPKTTMSGLLNRCLAEWIARHSRRELKSRLVAEYQSARQESRRISQDLTHVDKEGWPSW